MTSSPILSNDTDPDIDTLLACRPWLAFDSSKALTFEGAKLAEIAAQVGTPTWVIGAQTLRHRFQKLRRALDEAGGDVSIHYAVKANDHKAVLSLLSREGAGADIVSGGELARCLNAGVTARKIIFSGVGKSDSEIVKALQAGVGQINVESAEELHLISDIASQLQCMAPIVLRVNPDVDAHTHAKITTGLADNKFGIAFDEAGPLYLKASELPGLRPLGFAVHIGSQITSAEPYRAAFRRIAALVCDVRGQNATVDIIDCGGGLGISYRHEPEGSPAMLAGIIRSELAPLGTRFAVEPGRWLVGPCGLLLSRVVLRKSALNAPFLVLDAAMNDLLRPTLYDAWHGIVPLERPLGALQKTHVVGPVCETGDTFSHNRMLPPLQKGEHLALLDTGAYGSVMSSTYNSRPLAAQVMVNGPQWEVIRPRQDVEALWKGEALPAWIDDDKT